MGENSHGGLQRAGSFGLTFSKFFIWLYLVSEISGLSVLALFSIFSTLPRLDLYVWYVGLLIYLTFKLIAVSFLIFSVSYRIAEYNNAKLSDKLHKYFQYILKTLIIFFSPFFILALTFVSPIFVISGFPIFSLVVPIYLYTEYYTKLPQKIGAKNHLQAMKSAGEDGNLLPILLVLQFLYVLSLMRCFMLLPWIGTLGFVLYLVNLIALAGIWKFKKWGLYLYLAVFASYLVTLNFSNVVLPLLTFYPIYKIYKKFK